MTSPITVYHEHAGLSAEATDRIEAVIQAWLHTKARRTGSRKAEQAYRDAIVLIAQTWAGQSVKADHSVAASTHNQRLACLSSFYTYAQKAPYQDS